MKTKKVFKTIFTLITAIILFAGCDKENDVKKELNVSKWHVVLDVNIAGYNKFWEDYSPSFNEYIEYTTRIEAEISIDEPYDLYDHEATLWNYFDAYGTQELINVEYELTDYGLQEFKSISLTDTDVPSSYTTKLRAFHDVYYHDEYVRYFSDVYSEDSGGMVFFHVREESLTRWASWGYIAKYKDSIFRDPIIGTNGISLIGGMYHQVYMAFNVFYFPANVTTFTKTGTMTTDASYTYTGTYTLTVTGIN